VDCPLVVLWIFDQGTGCCVFVSIPPNGEREIARLCIQPQSKTLWRDESDHKQLTQAMTTTKS